MRLCASAALLLLLALTWTRADPTPSPGPDPGSEECSKLNLITDKTQVLGWVYFLAGFADNRIMKILLGLTNSVMGNMIETETGLRAIQFQKMNGTCYEIRTNMTTSGGTAKSAMPGVTSESQLFDSTNTSVIMKLNVTIHNLTFFRQSLKPIIDPKVLMDQNPSQEQGDNSHIVNGHAFYLIGIEPVPSETDLQQFLAHAKCAGFTGELDFIQKSDQEYCSKENSILLPENA